MDNKTKVILVEDDQLIRESFASLLNESEQLECIKTFGSCEAMLKEITELNPEVVLMDIELPGMSGIEGIKKIKKILPGTDIIAVTVHEDPQYVFDALCAGASGYLTKNISPRQLINAVIEAVNGGAPMSTYIARMVISSFHKSNASPLSPRETEVLQLLAKGKSYTMIADQLYIDKETVRSHIKNIYIKLEVNSKAAALDKATREKFI